MSTKLAGFTPEMLKEIQDMILSLAGDTSTRGYVIMFSLGGWSRYRRSGEEEQSRSLTERYVNDCQLSNPVDLPGPGTSDTPYSSTGSTNTRMSTAITEEATQNIRGGKRGVMGRRIVRRNS